MKLRHIPRQQLTINILKPEIAEQRYLEEVARSKKPVLPIHDLPTFDSIGKTVAPPRLNEKVSVFIHFC